MPLEVNFVSKCKLPQPDDLFGLLFSGLLLYNRAARGDDAFEIDELEEILAHLVTTGGEKCAFSRQKYQFLNRELQYGVSTQNRDFQSSLCQNGTFFPKLVVVWRKNDGKRLKSAH